MTTTVESTLDSSTLLSTTGLSKTSISTSISSITEILVLQTGQTLSISTLIASLTSEKAPATLVELPGFKTSIEIETVGGSTTITPAISGLNGRDGLNGQDGIDGATRLRDLTDVDITTLEDQYYLKYDLAQDKFVFSEVISNAQAPITLVLEKFVISGTDISNKYIELSHDPHGIDQLQVMIYSGPEQEYLVDYYVIGRRILWDGLSLELILEVGDKLQVQYQYLTV